MSTPKICYIYRLKYKQTIYDMYIIIHILLNFSLFRAEVSIQLSLFVHHSVRGGNVIFLAAIEDKQQEFLVTIPVTYDTFLITKGFMIFFKFLHIIISLYFFFMKTKHMLSNFLYLFLHFMSFCSFLLMDVILLLCYLCNI